MKYTNHMFEGKPVPVMRERLSVMDGDTFLYYEHYDVDPDDPKLHGNIHGWEFHDDYVLMLTHTEADEYDPVDLPF